MSLSLGFSPALRPYLSQEHAATKDLRRNAYVKAALKAFRKFRHNGKVFYTCNVARLHACNRLGEEKEVKLWRTHFFMSSPHFYEVSGVVFSRGPGDELLAHTNTLQLDFLYVKSGHRTAIDPKNGRVHEFEEDLVFASDEKAPLAA